MTPTANKIWLAAWTVQLAAFLVGMGVNLIDLGSVDRSNEVTSDRKEWAVLGQFIMIFVSAWVVRNFWRKLKS